MTVQTVADLNAHHAVAGARWVEGPGGPILEVQTEQCEARVSAYAAHVASWTPFLPGAASPAPGLFCSPRTAWGGGKAIRGGVPICWPWFGPRRHDPKPEGKASPAHGFARTRPWHVEQVELADNGRVEVTFLLVSDDDTLALWPHAFEARLVCALGTTLNLSLVVKNVDDAPFEMEGALHTYLTVSDVEQVKLTGLEGTRFFDKVAGVERSHGREPLVFSRRDRQCLSWHEAGGRHRGPGPRSAPSASRRAARQSTVVWNPWLVKATAMADLGGDVWRNPSSVSRPPTCAPHAVPLSPGATHTLSTRISITPARMTG
jgi:glucose-6-phosphate 1-epimerase